MKSTPGILSKADLTKGFIASYLKSVPKRVLPFKTQYFNTHTDSHMVFPASLLATFNSIHAKHQTIHPYGLRRIYRIYYDIIILAVYDMTVS